MLENLKIWLLGIGGLCYIIAAIVRWRGLSQSTTKNKRPWALLGTGLAAHICATVISFVISGGADFAYNALGSLFAALAMLIGTRFLSINSPGLLLLPVGIMALLVAIFGIIDSSNLGRSMDKRSWVFFIHIIFMSLNLAAVLLASAAAGMYLVVSKQLKKAPERALNLPQLPPLGILCERSLLVALAMQIGGMVSGAVAIGPDSTFTASHPTIVVGWLVMLVMALILILRALKRLSYRGLSWGTWAVLALTVIVLATLMTVDPHG